MPDDTLPTESPADAAASGYEMEIRARPGWQLINFAELWQYRELLGFLAVRDVRVRYKQTVLGGMWAIMQPLLKMAIFTFLFGGIAKLSFGDVPYAVAAFCGLLPWQLFAHALTQAGNSLIENERLVSKVYFPRLLIPFASVLSGLVDFAISFAILIAMMLWYGITPTPAALLLPLLVIYAVLAALAVGLWLSALNALYRDFRYTITFLTELWFFVTPVVYPLNIVSEKWQYLLALNPMYGVVECFRWALLGAPLPATEPLLISAAAVLVLLFGGAMYFRRMERSFADWI